MSMRIKGLLLTLFLVCLAGSGVAAQYPQVTLFLGTAKLEGVLQIVAFKMPQNAGQPPSLLFRNSSSKQIRDFTVRALIGPLRYSARSGVSGAEKPIWMEGSGDRPWDTEILPNGLGEARDVAFRADTLAFQAKRLRSNCLKVVPYVSHLTFADESTWEANFAVAVAAWDSAVIEQAGGSNCDSADTEKALARIQASATEHDGARTNLGLEPVQHYSVSCWLRDLHGEVTVVCPW